ncbi:MAG: serine/threonine-protein phosphatase [Planctomycetes bacterium]|nr:serine/threonine-protein phosphatase [Planctomycetota bacterium]
MEEELEHLQRLGKSLNEHFQHVDEEMRLAASLQRDFFPRSLELIGPLSIASLNRPASWVSGDAYDVFRVDERHVAFYVADVVGHGVAAGLLTMFIKHAVIGKRVTGHSYEVLEPGETLQRLNDALRQHALPKCQFVTAAYCLINTETLVMKYARGGHPYPILIDREGRSTELKATGGLMGLFDPAHFATEQVQLHPGEKVVLYSDGLEARFEANSSQSDPSRRGHRAVFELLSRSGATEMIARLNELLDARQRTDLPADDTTIVIAEVNHEDSSKTSPPPPSSVG